MFHIQERDKVVETLGWRKPYPINRWFTSRGLILHDGRDHAPKKEFINDDIHILAPVEGEIIYGDFQNPQNKKEGFGLHIVLLFMEKATYTIEIFYIGHLQEIYISKGLRVKKGTKIALMGNTGYSTKKHCHIGRKILLPYGRLKTVDPREILT